MRLQSVASIVAAVAGVAAQTTTPSGLVTGKLGNATAVSDNPTGIVYIATISKPFFQFAPNVKGEIAAVAAPDGNGVLFKVRFSNLPPLSQGPFPYHIHDQPVSDDGNCTATLAHLDPFQRGEDPACNQTLPQTCQVGDLAGKYGKITSDPFEETYHDMFTSTKQGIGAFFGNRSFVLHFPNKTRIACANFKVAQGRTTLPSTPSDSCSALNVTAAPTGSSSKPTQTFATAGAGALQSTVWGASAASMFMAIMFML